MIRALLTLVFSFTALLGPGFCCCTFARPHQAGVSTQARQLRSATSCCHCSHSDEEESAPTTPPARPACPCKEQQPQSCVASRIDLQADRSSVLQSWLPVLDSTWISYSVADLGYAATNVSSFNLPFLTADDLLRTHHIMRC